MISCCWARHPTQPPALAASTAACKPARAVGAARAVGKPSRPMPGFPAGNGGRMGKQFARFNVVVAPAGGPDRRAGGGARSARRPSDARMVPTGDCHKQSRPRLTGVNGQLYMEPVHSPTPTRTGQNGTRVRDRRRLLSVTGHFGAMFGDAWRELEPVPTGDVVGGLFGGASRLCCHGHVLAAPNVKAGKDAGAGGQQRQSRAGFCRMCLRCVNRLRLA